MYFILKVSMNQIVSGGMVMNATAAMTMPPGVTLGQIANGGAAVSAAPSFSVRRPSYFSLLQESDVPFLSSFRHGDDIAYLTDIDLEMPTARFHLSVWMNDATEDRKEKLRSLDCSHHLLSGRLTFLSETSRRAFRQWWNFYTERFFFDLDPMTHFFPVLRPGRLSGVLVERRSVLDQFLYEDQCKYDGYTAPISMSKSAIEETLPVWSWIVTNCQSPVLRAPHGWLFHRDTDAALFRMFMG